MFSPCPVRLVLSSRLQSNTNSKERYYKHTAATAPPFQWLAPSATMYNMYREKHTHLPADQETQNTNVRKLNAKITGGAITCVST